MRYEGSIEATIDRDGFYSAITDPRRVIAFMPDVVDSSIIDADHFSVKARVGAGPVRGILDMSFESVDKIAGSSARLKGHGRGMQSTVDIDLKISLTDAPGGSRAEWVAEASVGGLLASVGGRLIDGIAGKYVRQITDKIRADVSNPT